MRVGIQVILLFMLPWHNVLASVAAISHQTTVISSTSPTRQEFPITTAPSIINALFKTLLALAVVLVCMWLASALLKRMGGFSSQQGQRIQILASMPLGQREKVVLIEVEKQQLLLGVTANNITLLQTIAKKNEA